MILGVLLLASALMTVLGPRAGGKLRGLVHWALAPLGDAGMYLTAYVKRAGAHDDARLSREDIRRLQEENRTLRDRAAALESELIRAHEILTNGRIIFSSAFGPRQDVPVRLIPARVVAMDSLPYGRSRLINAGHTRGAQEGMYVTQRDLMTDRSSILPQNMAVLTRDGLVGQIIEAGAYTARVQLLTDPGFGMAAQVHRVLDPDQPREIRTGNRGSVLLTPQNNLPVDVYVRGDGSPKLCAENVSIDHAIRPGDVVQTRSNLGAVPFPVTIGTIRSVQRDADHAGRVVLTIEPAVDLPSLRTVYILETALDRMKSEAEGTKR